MNRKIRGETKCLGNGVIADLNTPLPENLSLAAQGPELNNTLAIIFAETCII